MKVNFNKAILGPDDLPISVNDKQGNKVRDITMKEMVLMALTSSDTAPEMTADEKVQHFMLAQKVAAAAKTVELTVEEATLIKKNIGIIGSIITVARIYETIDAAASK